MRSIATLQTPTSGSISFDGIDVIAEPEAIRARLGYLPQDFGVYPRVTAYAMLDHMAVLKGIAAKGERKTPSRPYSARSISGTFEKRQSLDSRAECVSALALHKP